MHITAVGVGFTVDLAIKPIHSKRNFNKTRNHCDKCDINNEF